MRTKLLSALLLASTAITGIASASPIVRDHRQPQPTAVVRHPQPQPQLQPQRQRSDRDHDRDRDYDRDRDNQWSGGVKVTARPTWMPVNYGFQVSAGNTVVPYAYGSDPYVESTPRSSWITLADQLRLNISNTQYIPVNNRVSVLELQSQWANVQIDSIRVDLADGRTINVQPERLLDRTHSPNLRIDLGAQAQCGVRGVTVYGSGGGTFRVLGA